MEQFRCPVCQTEFSTNEQLDRHMRQHDEQSRETRPQTSSEDERVNEGRDSRHARSSAAYPCPRCGREFSTHEELDRHGRAQHPAG